MTSYTAGLTPEQVERYKNSLPNPTDEELAEIDLMSREAPPEKKIRPVEEARIKKLYVFIKKNKHLKTRELCSKIQWRYPIFKQALDELVSRKWIRPKREGLGFVYEIIK